MRGVFDNIVDGVEQTLGARNIGSDDNVEVNLQLAGLISSGHRPIDTEGV